MLKQLSRWTLPLLVLSINLLGSACGHTPLVPHDQALRLHKRAVDQVVRLNEQAVEMKKKGQYREGIAIAKKAVSLSEQLSWLILERYMPVEGRPDPTVAYSLNTLASLLTDTGDYAGARPLLERSLKIREQALALVDLAINRYGAGTPLMQEYRALQAKNVALSLAVLASLLQWTGDHAGARSRLERSLELSERTVGPNPHLVALTLRSLALAQLGSGDRLGARRSYERALNIYRQVRGPNHPDVAAALDGMAGCVRLTDSGRIGRSL